MRDLAFTSPPLRDPRAEDDHLKGDELLNEVASVGYYHCRATVQSLTLDHPVLPQPMDLNLVNLRDDADLAAIPLGRFGEGARLLETFMTSADYAAAGDRQ